MERENVMGRVKVKWVRKKERRKKKGWAWRWLAVAS